MKYTTVDRGVFAHSSRWNADFFLLRDDETYDIGDGFEVRRLGELIQERREFLNPPDFPDWRFNYVGLENIARHTRLLVDFEPRMGKSIKSRSKVFRLGDVLYGRLRPGLDKCLVVEDDLHEGICSTEILVLVPRSEALHPEYLAQILVSKQVHDRVVSLVAGAALPRLQPADLLDIMIPVPSIDQQHMIASQIAAWRDRIKDWKWRLEVEPEELRRAFSKHVYEAAHLSLDPSMTRPKRKWQNELPNDLSRRAGRLAF